MRKVYFMALKKQLKAKGFLSNSFPLSCQIFTIAVRKSNFMWKKKNVICVSWQQECLLWTIIEILELGWEVANENRLNEKLPS